MAMFSMTVVSDPAKVMNELSRVTELGVPVLVVDHFSAARRIPSVIKKEFGASCKQTRVVTGISN
jgi:diaminopimelate decarboxylase